MSPKAKKEVEPVYDIAAEGIVLICKVQPPACPQAGWQRLKAFLVSGLVENQYWNTKSKMTQGLAGNGVFSLKSRKLYGVSIAGVLRSPNRGERS